MTTPVELKGYGLTIYPDNGDGMGEYLVYRDGLFDDSLDVPDMVCCTDIPKIKFRTQKPDFPYAVGNCFKAQSHIPQSFNDLSWGKSYFCNHEDYCEQDTVSPLHRCSLHPPSPGEIKPGEVEFKIVSSIQAGDPQDSQVLTVRILNSNLGLPTSMDVLAKVYDPLYVNHMRNIDPFRYMDYTYRNEARAYKQLVDIQGSIIPKYHGSFTLMLPGDGKHSREVRLALMELVPGTTLDNLSPSSFEQSMRQEIMKAIVDADRAIFNKGKCHGDLHMRNTLLPPRQLGQGQKVVIVDFAMSFDSNPSFSKSKEHSPLKDVLLPQFHCIDPVEKFGRWVDWDWDAWINQQYIHTKGSCMTPREISEIRLKEINSWDNETDCWATSD